MPIFIPVDIVEDVIKSVKQNIWGSLGPRGTDSEALQGWILKYGEDSKIIRGSVGTFFDWISNKILSWLPIVNLCLAD